jgi:D-alanine--poly(phosphoribitol) ligase subunit 2
MNELLKILEGLHPEVDFEACNSLIDDNILDSFDIVTLISDICDEFDITVPVEEIDPNNFNSARALYGMIERLQEE